MVKKNLLIILIVFNVTLHVASEHYANTWADRSKIIARKLEHLVNLLKRHEVSDQNGPIKLIRLGNANDGGYVVPEIALKKAAAVLGYGIYQDISFEEEFSNRYHKKSYGFDCSKDVKINIKNKLCHFIPECIATNKFAYKLNDSMDHSSLKTSSFNQHLKRFNLEGEKVFIKMDIEGSEYYTFHEILKHAKNITGIALEIHIFDDKHIQKAINLLSTLNKYFILIHIHGNNINDMEGRVFTAKNLKGRLSKSFELTYINKSLVSKSKVAKIHSYPLPIDMPSSTRTEDMKFEIIFDKDYK